MQDMLFSTDAMPAKAVGASGRQTASSPGTENTGKAFTDMLAEDLPAAPTMAVDDFQFVSSDHMSIPLDRPIVLPRGLDEFHFAPPGESKIAEAVSVRPDPVDASEVPDFTELNQKLDQLDSEVEALAKTGEIDTAPAEIVANPDEPEDQPAVETAHEPQNGPQNGPVDPLSRQCRINSLSDSHQRTCHRQSANPGACHRHPKLEPGPTSPWVSPISKPRFRPLRWGHLPRLHLCLWSTTRPSPTFSWATARWRKNPSPPGPHRHWPWARLERPHWHSRNSPLQWPTRRFLP